MENKEFEKKREDLAQRRYGMSYWSLCAGRRSAVESVMKAEELDD